MQKNKVSRVVTISPTAKHAKKQITTINHLHNNKAVTPIKPLKQSRITTAATTAANHKSIVSRTKQEDLCSKGMSHRAWEDDNISQHMPKSSLKNKQLQRPSSVRGFQADRTTANHQMDSIYLSISKDSSHNKFQSSQSKQSNNDLILHRISANFMNSIEGAEKRSSLDKILQNSDPSNKQMYKKTQIGKLRQLIDEAKKMLLDKKNILGAPSTDQNSEYQLKRIDSFKMQLMIEIKSWFEELWLQIKKKQNEMLTQLQQKIMEIKEKSITRTQQSATLCSYAQKCERDLNDNYEGIINDLSIKDFKNIVASYTEKLKFYMSKSSSQHHIQFIAPNLSSICEQLQEVRLQIRQSNQGKANPEVEEQFCNSLSSLKQNQSGLVCTKIDHRKNDLKQKISIKSLDKHKKGTKSVLQQLQNTKYDMFDCGENGKYACGEKEIRIASARGKY